MSSYNSVDLFGSGPHRFALAKQGSLFLLDKFDHGTSSRTNIYGPAEQDVVVTGRLVAASEGALWTLRDAIRNQLTPATTPVQATLADGKGRTWSDMTLLTFAEDTRVDRGRVWSVAYTAVFRKILP